MSYDELCNSCGTFHARAVMGGRCVKHEGLIHVLDFRKNSVEPINGFYTLHEALERVDVNGDALVAWDRDMGRVDVAAFAAKSPYSMLLVMYKDLVKMEYGSTLSALWVCDPLPRWMLSKLKTFPNKKGRRKPVVTQEWEWDRPT